ncbi:hypothetical protein ACIB24_05320 [Spongisporangium articulatum]|uniref:C2H2-type domain-containing protein n=1 Tax=Spongisporangium articulatum TaxID=3362603 RepID=A0ABW8ALG8_9ACTN
MDSTERSTPPWQRSAGAPACPACGKTCPADGDTCEHCGALLHPQRPDRGSNRAVADPFNPWSAVQDLKAFMPPPGDTPRAPTPTPVPATGAPVDGDGPVPPDPVADAPAAPSGSVPAAIPAPGVPPPPGSPPAPALRTPDEPPPAPGLPQAPGQPHEPGLPHEPGHPHVPGLPQVPGQPQAPAVPQAPGQPQAPGVPPLPGALRLPGGRVPTVLPPGLSRAALQAIYEKACEVPDPPAALDGNVPLPVVRPTGPHVCARPGALPGPVLSPALALWLKSAATGLGRPEV